MGQNNFRNRFGTAAWWMPKAHAANAARISGKELPTLGASMRSAKAIVLPIAALLVAAGSCARAEIRVEGPVDDVRVEANGATVVEVLAALGEHYPVRFHGTPGSGDVIHTFKGPLRRVLVRVLKGNDFVIKGGADGFEVIVLSQGSPAAAPPVIPASLVRRPELQVQGPALRVQGPADDVRVEANGATVVQILTALGEHYPVRYRGNPQSGGVIETFEGPLRRVLVRVLKGNDFVVKGGGDGLDVIVLSRGSPASPAVTATIRDPFMRK